METGLEALGYFTISNIPKYDKPLSTLALNVKLRLYDEGSLEEAEPLYQRALAIDMAALGASHPNIATYLNNLAGLYKAGRRASYTTGPPPPLQQLLNLSAPLSLT